MHTKSIRSLRALSFLMGASALHLLPIPDVTAQETVGGGTLASPGNGPAPSYGLGGPGLTLVKNWDFGYSASNTVKNMTDMTANFYYHDQYNSASNGGKYGSITVAPNDGSALANQPIEGINTAGAVRAFTSASLKTFMCGLNGSTTVDASTNKAGNGSFMAKWELPHGGSLLNQDIVWETKVRYVTPKYFWFAIWNAGNLWNNGAEIDIVESFGFDNGGVNTNYEGDYWHSAVAGGTNTATSYANWGNGMASRGITNFDATQYHIWTLVYRVNNTFSSYVDGIEVQSGNLNWTRGGILGGTPIDMDFLFDAGWGHERVASVNHSMPVSEFVGKYYEWDYSRIYLSPVGGGTDIRDNVYTFDNGNGIGWSAGTTAPWSITWDGADYSYDCAFGYSGIPANTAGLPTWANYEINLDMNIGQMSPWSDTYIYGRYTDADNNYVLDLELTNTGYRASLVKRVAAVNTLLGSYNFPAIPALNTWANVSLSMNAGALVVKYNGTPIITATDPTPIAAGKMGLSTKKQGVRFDNISTPVTTLLSEDLSDGVANGWTPTPAAPWTVVSDAGNNRYKFDFSYGANETGTSLGGNAAWTDYTVKTDVKLTDFQGWGRVQLDFRYVDDNNYYSAQLLEYGGNRRVALIKRVAGVDYTLGSYLTTISLNTLYNLSIGGVGGNVVVKFNGAPIISVSDNAFTAGKIRIGAWKADVLWDNIQVTQN